MTPTKIVAQRGGPGGFPVEIELDMGDTLQELVEQFGDDITYSHARRSIVIAAQGFMRGLMDRGKEENKSEAQIADDIVQAMKGWKPSQKKAPKTTTEKARDFLSRMSPAERAALLKEFRAKPQAADAA